MIKALHRSKGRERQFTQKEWKSALEGYKAKGKNILDYYSIIEDVKKEEPEKAQEPEKNNPKTNSNA